MFLRNFVTSYAYKDGVVKLGLNVNAPEGADIYRPSKPDGEHHHAKIGLAIAISLLIIIVIVIVIWCCIDKRRQHNEEIKAIAYAEIEKYGEPRSVNLNASSRDSVDSSSKVNRNSYKDKYDYKKGQERLKLVGAHDRD